MAGSTEGDERTNGRDVARVITRQHAKNILEYAVSQGNGPVEELRDVLGYIDSEIREEIIGNSDTYPSYGIRVNVFGIDREGMAHTYASSRWVDEAKTLEAADEIAKRVIELYEIDVKDEIDRVVARTGVGEQDDITGEITV